MPRYAHSGPAWVEITHDPQSQIIPGAGQKPERQEGGGFQMKPDDLIVYVGWAEAQSTEFLQSIGVAEIVVDEAVAPGFRPAGRELVDVDGVPTSRYVQVALSLPELRAAKLAAAFAEYQSQRQSPFTWDFGSTVAVDDDDGDQSPAGVQTLQMRDSAGVDDIKNWSLALQAASLAYGAGGGAVVQPIKTTANVWVQTTALQVLQVLMLGDGTQVPAFGRGVAQLRVFGKLKKAIADAATAEALEAIDVSDPPGGPWPN